MEYLINQSNNVIPPRLESMGPRALEEKEGNDEELSTEDDMSHDRGKAIDKSRTVQADITDLCLITFHEMSKRGPRSGQSSWPIFARELFKNNFARPPFTGGVESPITCTDLFFFCKSRIDGLDVGVNNVAHWHPYCCRQQSDRCARTQ